ncbi:MAG: DNA-processing protein DprA, partial [Candidatus Nealsonbacteria bacterium]
GKQVVEKIVSEVAAAGVTIVSGFMYGIDATAHKAALQVGSRTIAVMPCGIDLIHPEHQQDLYMEILNSQGLVISEYEGNMAPTLWSYPRRNRIVAGLSKAALIIEAGEKSGSLITASLAKKFKRKVFVVPGPITSENSKGIMQLIKEGATAINSADDILREYGFSSRFTLSSSGSDATRKNHNSLEEKILNHLQRESLNTDNLSRVLNKSAAELGVLLSTMELKGVIKQEGNKYYAN